MVAEVSAVLYFNRGGLMRKRKRVRNPAAAALASRTGSYAGRHGNRKYSVVKGSSRKAKHKRRYDGLRSM